MKQDIQHLVKKAQNEKTFISIDEVLEYFFDSFQKEIFIECIQQNDCIWTSKQSEKCLYLQLSNFQIADLHYLTMHNQVKFLYLNLTSLEKILLLTSFEEFQSVFTFDESEISIDSYIISKRPSFWKKFWEQKDYNFSRYFIYYYNYDSQKNFENKICNEIGVKWDLLGLKTLYSKIKMIEDINGKKLDYLKQYKIGIFGDEKFIEYQQRTQFFQDGDGLIFQYMDPFNMKSYNQEIDAFYCKFSYLMTYYQWFTEEQIFEKLKEASNILKKLEQIKNKKIIQFNKIDLFLIFVDRVNLYKFMNSLFKETSFIKGLKDIGDVQLSFPKTVEITGDNFGNFKSIVDDSQLEFPILIKTRWAANCLTPHSHMLIIFQNKNTLCEAFEENRFDMKNKCPLVLQELISPVPCCMKVYSSMGQQIISYFNTLDLEQLPDCINIDGEQELKFQSSSKSMNTDTAKQISQYLSMKLDEKGICNYGVDIIQKENTNEYFVIDLNYDTFTWLRLDNNIRKIEDIRNNLKKQIMNKQIQIKHGVNKERQKLKH